MTPDTPTDPNDLFQVADRSYFSFQGSQPIDYEVRGAASCGRCGLFYLGSKSGQIYEISRVFGERTRSWSPPTPSSAQSISVVCGPDKRKSARGCERHRVFVGTEDGDLIVADAGFASVCVFHLGATRVVDMSQDERPAESQKDKHLLAITHVSVLLPSVYDAVGPGPRSPFGDNPLGEKRSILLIAGQRNGRWSILRYDYPEGSQPGQLHRVRVWNDGDWLLQSFLVPQRVSAGRRQARVFTLVCVTTRGSVYEIDVDELRAKNGGIDNEPNKTTVARFATSLQSVEYFRARGRTDYTLVGASPDGLWTCRRGAAPKLFHASSGRGPFISLAKCQTYDRFYLVAGSANGVVHGFRLARPEAEHLLDARQAFELPVDVRPLTMSFVRYCPDPHRRAIDRRKGEQVHLLVGGDAGRAPLFYVCESHAYRKEVERQIEKPRRRHSSALEQLLERAESEKKNRPAASSEWRFFLRHLVPDALAKELRRASDPNLRAQGQDKEASAWRNAREKNSDIAKQLVALLLREGGRRTATAAIRLLERYSPIFKSDDLIELSVMILERIGPVDETPSVAQPARRLLDRLLRITTASRLHQRDYRGSKERQKLSAWHDFIVDFIAGGHTYSSKQHHLFSLVETNTSIGRHLDALIYCGRLAYTRYDSLWEARASGFLWAVAHAGPFVIASESHSDSGPGSLLIYDAETGARLRCVDEASLAGPSGALAIQAPAARLNTHGRPERGPLTTGATSDERYTRFVCVLGSPEGDEEVTLLVAWRAPGNVRSGTGASAPTVEVLRLQPATEPQPIEAIVRPRKVIVRREICSEVILPAEVYSAVQLDDSGHVVLLGLQDARVPLVVVRATKGGWKTLLESSGGAESGVEDRSVSPYLPVWALVRIDTATTTDGESVIAFGSADGVVTIATVSYGNESFAWSALAQIEVGAPVRSIATAPSPDRESFLLLVGDEAGGLRCFRFPAKQNWKAELELERQWVQQLASTVRRVALWNMPEYEGELVAAAADESGHLGLYRAEQAGIELGGSRRERLSIRRNEPPSQRSTAQRRPLYDMLRLPARMQHDESTELIVASHDHTIRLRLCALKGSSSRASLREREARLFEKFYEADLLGVWAEESSQPALPASTSDADEANLKARRRLCRLPSLHPPVLWMSTATKSWPDERVLKALDVVEAVEPTARKSTVINTVLRHPDYHYETTKVHLKRFVRAVLSADASEMDTSRRLLQLLDSVESFFCEWRGQRRANLRTVFYRELITARTLALLHHSFGVEETRLSDELRRRLSELAFAADTGPQFELIQRTREAMERLPGVLVGADLSSAFASLCWIAEAAAKQLVNVHAVWTPYEVACGELLAACFTAMSSSTYDLCKRVAARGICGRAIVEVSYMIGKKDRSGDVTARFQKYFLPIFEGPRARLVPDTNEALTPVGALGRLYRQLERLRQFGPNLHPSPPDHGAPLEHLLSRIHVICSDLPSDAHALREQQRLVAKAMVRLEQPRPDGRTFQEPHRTIATSVLEDWQRRLTKRRHGPFPTRSGEAPVLWESEISGHQGYRGGVFKVIVEDNERTRVEFSYRTVAKAQLALRDSLDQMVPPRGSVQGIYEQSWIAGENRMDDTYTERLDSLVRESIAKVVDSTTKLEHGLDGQCMDILIDSALPEVAAIPWQLMPFRKGFLGQHHLCAVIERDDLEQKNFLIGQEGRPRVLAAVDPDMQSSYGEDSKNLGGPQIMWLGELAAAGSIELVGKRVANSAEELQEIASTEPFDILYLFCHGRFETMRLFMQPSDLYSGRTAEELFGEAQCSEHRPIALLNACHAGSVDPWDESGTVLKMRKLGFSAVVAPITSIAVSACDAFGRLLLENFLRPSSLGHAVSAAQLQLLKDHNDPTGLLYTLYGLPALQLAAAPGRA